MTKVKAKKEAWKNQNPVILKTSIFKSGYQEHIWLPLELWESQGPEFNAMGLEMVCYWDALQKVWVSQEELDGDVSYGPSFELEGPDAGCKEFNNEFKQWQTKREND